MDSDDTVIPITSEQLKHEYEIMLFHTENLEMQIIQLKKRKRQQENTYEQCNVQLVEQQTEISQLKEQISQLKEQNTQLKRDNTTKTNELIKISRMFQKINDYLNSEQQNKK